MPLNPNGKIDKPRLPFPDTSTASQPSKKKKAAAGGAEPARVLTPTEEAVHAIWHRLLPSPPSEIALDDNFFDLGGHSIIATRLVFEIRKHFVVAAPLGLVFDQPTIRGLAAALDALRQGELGFEAPVPSSSSAAATPADVSGEGVSASGEDYAKDLPILTKELAPSYAALPADFSSKPLTVFLTGATGFLGAFILRDLLARRGVDRVKKVVCLVRAKTAEQGLARLRESGEGRAVWDEKWVSEGRVESVLGDLAETKFGLDDKTWSRIAEEADVVVHNGALVHWVYGYGRLRAPNVLSTLTALSLCAEHHPKAFSFVSTTATVETEHFVRLSEQLISSGKGDGVPESDDLDGARTGLTTGYGQTKWVAERLIMEAGKRGLAGWIVRPGYIVGDSENAVTNTDDFIWRLVKGSIQLGLVPDINNTINMVPVDHVARITAVSAVSPPSSSSSSSSPFGAVSVAHVTSRPATRYNDLLSPLAAYGYGTQTTSYLDWRAKLEAHVLEVGDNALFPLLHFVLDDLPTSTKSAELDDSNTRALLRGAGEREGMNVSGEILGRYLAWLIKAGFLDQPTGEKTLELPVLEGDARAIGRSSGA
jgi:L-2-aminoadipate reductase